MIMHNTLQELDDDNSNEPGAMPGSDARSRFEDQLSAALKRFAGKSAELDPWEEENMVSALGAAALAEYELAAAFVEAAARPPIRAVSTRNFRRPSMSVVALRRRFERMRMASP